MNYDEFAFFNQQLAGMLKSGIPLEGALRQLCTQMKRGRLRDELQQLENDLGRGVPLEKALAGRQLPEFYVRMIQVGVRGNDLPGVLTLVADYYQKADVLRTRLKGLLTYPLIVLIASSVLSLLIAFLFASTAGAANSAWRDMISGTGISGAFPSGFVLFVWSWLPALLLLLLAFVAIAVLSTPALRRRFRWCLPGFKEASLSQFAASASLLLKSGNDLNDSLALLNQLENGTPAGNELSHWRARLASGSKEFSDVAGQSTVFPPLFIWLVASAGEDWVAGFSRAAEIFHNRAMNRAETLLYAALPASVLMLGIIIMSQFLPIIRTFVSFVRMFLSFGDI